MEKPLTAGWSLECVTSLFSCGYVCTFVMCVCGDVETHGCTTGVGPVVRVRTALCAATYDTVVYPKLPTVPTQVRDRVVNSRPT